jgi:small subunit ribosomal protein S4
MAEERKLLQRYALKNKRELWKAQSVLRGFRRQARDLQARLRAGEAQARRETDLLLARLARLGLFASANATLDDVLALNPEDLLKRRFDFVTFRKGLAPTAIAARKWIVHGHLLIGSHKVTRPGYLVRSEEEGSIAYAPASPLSSEEHPTRVALRERESRSPAALPSAPEGM